MRKTVIVWLFFAMLTLQACASRVPTTIEIEGFTLEGNVFSREVASHVSKLPLLITLYPNDDYQLFNDMMRQEPITGNVVDLVKGRNTFYLAIDSEKRQELYVIVVTVLPQYFTLSYQTGGGTQVRSETVLEGNSASVPNTPLRVGYHFLRWSTHPTLDMPYTFTSPVTQNITLYAVWGHNSYTITFHTQGGSAIPAMEVPYLGSLSALPVPQRPGFTFMGWTLDTAGLEPLLLTSMPAHSLTLYAKWSN